MEIEARIVTTTRDFARRIGVQWGFNGRVAQDLGNTTNLAFPNQGSLGGRTGGMQGSNLGAAADHASTAVNLGVGTASSAIGLALGSVNGALNLDVALSALEESGNGRILSTPRVSTQNNVPAEITQGVQIPIQTVANNTVTVVVPRCGAEAERDAADHGGQHRHHADRARELVAGLQPCGRRHSADQHAARRDVAARVGRTDIGHRRHLHQLPAIHRNDRTPGLYKIPILGWLFQRRELTEESRELLIFITPRIIKS